MITGGYPHLWNPPKWPRRSSLAKLVTKLAHIRAARRSHDSHISVRRVFNSKPTSRICHVLWSTGILRHHLCAASAECAKFAVNCSCKQSVALDMRIQNQLNSIMVSMKIILESWIFPKIHCYRVDEHPFTSNFDQGNCHLAFSPHFRTSP